LKLTELIAPVPALTGLNDADIVGLTADSRNVQPGFLFAALPGTRQDGRSFAADAIARGVADDLVIDVGNVHDIAHVVARLPEESLQQVDGNKGAEVADVSIIIDGRAAGIHVDFFAAQRAELFDLRRHGVVKA